MATVLKKNRTVPYLENDYEIIYQTILNFYNIKSGKVLRKLDVLFYAKLKIQRCRKICPDKSVGESGKPIEEFQLRVTLVTSLY